MLENDDATAVIIYGKTNFLTRADRKFLFPMFTLNTIIHSFDWKNIFHSLIGVEKNTSHCTNIPLKKQQQNTAVKENFSQAWAMQSIKKTQKAEGTFSKNSVPFLVK